MAEFLIMKMQSKWVAKVMVDKFKSNSNMALKDIIYDIRNTYSTSTTMLRAFKARQITTTKKTFNGNYLVAII